MLRNDPTDFDFSQAGKFDAGFRGLANSIRTPELKPSVVAFAANMERVASIQLLPIELLYWQQTLQALAITSSHEFSGEHGVSQFTLNILEKQGFKRSLSKEDWVKFTADGIEHLGNLLRFEFGLTGANPYLMEGLTSLLFSMVSSSYAAFEALVIDLWLGAVNLRSGRLSGNLVKMFGAKNVKLSTLMQSKYDVKTELGMFLKEQGIVTFQTLDGIRDAYDRGFGDTEGSGPPSPLTGNRSIVKASKVRNLIAHRAGLVDEVFVSEVKGFQEFDYCEIGQYLKITGPIACSLIDSCVTTAVKSVVYVDDWITTHGTNSP